MELADSSSDESSANMSPSNDKSANSPRTTVEHSVDTTRIDSDDTTANTKIDPVDTSSTRTDPADSKQVDITEIDQRDAKVDATKVEISKIETLESTAQLGPVEKTKIDQRVAPSETTKIDGSETSTNVHPSEVAQIESAKSDHVEAATNADSSAATKIDPLDAPQADTEHSISSRDPADRTPVGPLISISPAEAIDSASGSPPADGDTSVPHVDLSSVSPQTLHVTSLHISTKTVGTSVPADHVIQDCASGVRVGEAGDAAAIAPAATARQCETARVHSVTGSDDADTHHLPVSEPETVSCGIGRREQSELTVAGVVRDLLNVVVSLRTRGEDFKCGDSDLATDSSEAFGPQNSEGLKCSDVVLATECSGYEILKCSDSVVATVCSQSFSQQQQPSEISTCGDSVLATAECSESPGQGGDKAALDTVDAVVKKQADRSVDFQLASVIPDSDQPTVFVASVKVDCGQLEDLNAFTLDDSDPSEDLVGSAMVERDSPEDLVGSAMVDSDPPEDLVGSAMVERDSPEDLVDSAMVDSDPPEDLVGSAMVERDSPEDLVGSAMVERDSPEDLVGSAMVVSDPPEDLVGSAMVDSDSPEDLVGSAVVHSDPPEDLVGSAMVDSDPPEDLVGSAMVDSGHPIEVLASVKIESKLPHEVVPSVAINSDQRQVVGDCVKADSDELRALVANVKGSSDQLVSGAKSDQPEDLIASVNVESEPSDEVMPEDHSDDLRRVQTQPEHEVQPVPDLFPPRPSRLDQCSPAFLSCGAAQRCLNNAPDVAKMGSITAAEMSSTAAKMDSPTAAEMGSTANEMGSVTAVAEVGSTAAEMSSTTADSPGDHMSALQPSPHTYMCSGDVNVHSSSPNRVECSIASKCLSELCDAVCLAVCEEDVIPSRDIGHGELVAEGRDSEICLDVGNCEVSKCEEDVNVKPLDNVVLCETEKDGNEVRNELSLRQLGESVNDESAIKSPVVNNLKSDCPRPGSEATDVTNVECDKILIVSSLGTVKSGASGSGSVESSSAESGAVESVTVESCSAEGDLVTADSGISSQEDKHEEGVGLHLNQVSAIVGVVQSLEIDSVGTTGKLGLEVTRTLKDLPSSVPVEVEVSHGADAVTSNETQGDVKSVTCHIPLNKLSDIFENVAADEAPNSLSDSASRRETKLASADISSNSVTSTDSGPCPNGAESRLRDGLRSKRSPRVFKTCSPRVMKVSARSAAGHTDEPQNVTRSLRRNNARLINNLPVEAPDISKRSSPKRSPGRPSKKDLSRKELLEKERESPPVTEEAISADLAVVSANQNLVSPTKIVVTSENKFSFQIEDIHLMKLSGAEKLFACDICDGVYQRAFSLKRHYLRSHINYKYLTERDISNCGIVVNGNMAVSSGENVTIFMQNSKITSAMGDAKHSPTADEEPLAVQSPNGQIEFHTFHKKLTLNGTRDDREAVVDESRETYEFCRSLVEGYFENVVLSLTCSESGSNISKTEMSSLTELGRTVSSVGTGSDLRKIVELNESDVGLVESGVGRLDATSADITSTDSMDTCLNSSKTLSEFKSELEKDKLVNSKLKDNSEPILAVTGSILPELFRCHFCGLCFDIKTELKLHLKNHSVLVSVTNPYRCTLCTDTFAIKTELARHVASHNQSEQASRNQLCLYCEKQFGSTSILRRHMTRSHESPTLKSSKRQKLQLCSYCPESLKKKFKNLKVLLKHLISDHSDVYHACFNCEGRFENRHLLDRHDEVVHGKERVLLEHLSIEIGDVNSYPGSEVSDGKASPYSDSASPLPSKEPAGKKPPDGNAKQRAGNFEAKNTENLEGNHQDSFQYSCDICRKLFTNYVNMCRHRRLAHSKLGRSKKADFLSKKYFCKTSPKEKSPQLLATTGDSYKASSSDESVVDPETLFYLKLADNIRENLLHHLDGRLDAVAGKDEAPTEREATAATDVAAADPPVDRCIAEELERSQVECRKETEEMANAVEKYNYPKKYIVKRRSDRFKNSYKGDMSYLDISTQLIVKRNTERCNARLSESGSDVSQESFGKLGEVTLRFPEFLQLSKHPNPGFTNYLHPAQQPSVPASSEHQVRTKSSKPQKIIMRVSSRKLSLRQKSTESEVRETNEELLNSLVASSNNLDSAVPPTSDKSLRQPKLDSPAAKSVVSIASNEPPQENPPFAETCAGGVDESEKSVVVKAADESGTVMTSIQTSETDPVETAQVPADPAALMTIEASKTQEQSETKGDEVVQPPTLAPAVAAMAAVTARAEFSGDWVRPRTYVCAACNARFADVYDLQDHKWSLHPNAWVSHFEFYDAHLQTNPSDTARMSLELYKRYLQQRGALVSAQAVAPHEAVLRCSKCSRAYSALPDFHRHILECGGDTTWAATMFAALPGAAAAAGAAGGAGRRSRKWRPFGTRKRRQQGTRTRGMKRNIPNTPVKAVVHKVKSNRTNDAETIQRMIANLPPKRSTRRAIQFKEDEMKTRSQATFSSVTFTSHFPRVGHRGRRVLSTERGPLASKMAAKRGKPLASDRASVPAVPKRRTPLPSEQAVKRGKQPAPLEQPAPLPAILKKPSKTTPQVAAAVAVVAKKARPQKLPSDPVSAKAKVHQRTPKAAAAAAPPVVAKLIQTAINFPKRKRVGKAIEATEAGGSPAALMEDKAKPDGPVRVTRRSVDSLAVVGGVPATPKKKSIGRPPKRKAPTIGVQRKLTSLLPIVKPGRNAPRSAAKSTAEPVASPAVKSLRARSVNANVRVKSSLTRVSKDVAKENNEKTEESETSNILAAMRLAMLESEQRLAKEQQELGATIAAPAKVNCRAGVPAKQRLVSSTNNKRLKPAAGSLNKITTFFSSESPPKTRHQLGLEVVSHAAVVSQPNLNVTEPSKNLIVNPDVSIEETYNVQQIPTLTETTEKLKLRLENSRTPPKTLRGKPGNRQRTTLASKTRSKLIHNQVVHGQVVQRLKKTSVERGESPSEPIMCLGCGEEFSNHAGCERHRRKCPYTRPVALPQTQASAASVARRQLKCTHCGLQLKHHTDRVRHQIFCGKIGASAAGGRSRAGVKAAGGGLPVSDSVVPARHASPAVPAGTIAGSTLATSVAGIGVDSGRPHKKPPPPVPTRASVSDSASPGSQMSNCSGCGEVFSNRTAYARHQRKCVHARGRGPSAADAGSATPGSEPTIICSQCTGSYTNRTAYMRHRKKCVASQTTVITIAIDAEPRPWLEEAVQGTALKNVSSEASEEQLTETPKEQLIETQKETLQEQLIETQKETLKEQLIETPQETVKEMLKEPLKETRKETAKEPFICAGCGVEFSNHTACERHKRKCAYTSQKLKPVAVKSLITFKYACVACSKQFIYEGRFNLHKRTCKKLHAVKGLDINNESVAQSDSVIPIISMSDSAVETHVNDALILVTAATEDGDVAVEPFVDVLNDFPEDLPLSLLIEKSRRLALKSKPVKRLNRKYARTQNRKPKKLVVRKSPRKPSPVKIVPSNSEATLDEKMPELEKQEPILDVPVVSPSNLSDIPILSPFSDVAIADEVKGSQAPLATGHIEPHEEKTDSVSDVNLPVVALASLTCDTPSKPEVKSPSPLKCAELKSKQVLTDCNALPALAPPAAKGRRSVTKRPRKNNNAASLNDGNETSRTENQTTSTDCASVVEPSPILQDVTIPTLVNSLPQSVLTSSRPAVTAELIDLEEVLTKSIISAKPLSGVVTEVEQHHGDKKTPNEEQTEVARNSSVSAGEAVWPPAPTSKSGRRTKSLAKKVTTNPVPARLTNSRNARLISAARESPVIQLVLKDSEEKISETLNLPIVDKVIELGAKDSEITKESLARKAPKLCKTTKAQKVPKVQNVNKVRKERSNKTAKATKSPEKVENAPVHSSDCVTDNNSASQENAIAGIPIASDEVQTSKYTKQRKSPTSIRNTNRRTRNIISTEIPLNGAGSKVVSPTQLHFETPPFTDPTRAEHATALDPVSISVPSEGQPSPNVAFSINKTKKSRITDPIRSTDSVHEISSPSVPATKRTVSPDASFSECLQFGIVHFAKRQKVCEVIIEDKDTTKSSLFEPVKTNLVLPCISAAVTHKEGPVTTKENTVNESLKLKVTVENPTTTDLPKLKVTENNPMTKERPKLQMTDENKTIVECPKLMMALIQSLKKTEVKAITLSQDKVADTSVNVFKKTENVPYENGKYSSRTAFDDLIANNSISIDPSCTVMAVNKPITLNNTFAKLNKIIDLPKEMQRTKKIIITAPPSHSESNSLTTMPRDSSNRILPGHVTASTDLTQSPPLTSKSTTPVDGAVLPAILTQSPPLTSKSTTPVDGAMLPAILTQSPPLTSKSTTPVDGAMLPKIWESTKSTLTLNDASRGGKVQGCLGKKAPRYQWISHKPTTVDPVTPKATVMDISDSSKTPVDSSKPLEIVMSTKSTTKPVNHCNIPEIVEIEMSAKQQQEDAKSIGDAVLNHSMETESVPDEAATKAVKKTSRQVRKAPPVRGRQRGGRKRSAGIGGRKRSGSPVRRSRPVRSESPGFDSRLSPVDRRERSVRRTRCNLSYEEMYTSDVASEASSYDFAIREIAETVRKPDAITVEPPSTLILHEAAVDKNQPKKIDVSIKHDEQPKIKIVEKITYNKTVTLRSPPRVESPATKEHVVKDLSAPKSKSGDVGGNLTESALPKVCLTAPAPIPEAGAEPEPKPKRRKTCLDTHYTCHTCTKHYYSNYTLTKHQASPGHKLKVERLKAEADQSEESAPPAAATVTVWPAAAATPAITTKPAQPEPYAAGHHDVKINHKFENFESVSKWLRQQDKDQSANDSKERESTEIIDNLTNKLEKSLVERGRQAHKCGNVAGGPARMMLGNKAASTGPAADAAGSDWSERAESVKEAQRTALERELNPTFSKQALERLRLAVHQNAIHTRSENVLFDKPPVEALVNNLLLGNPSVIGLMNPLLLKKPSVVGLGLANPFVLSKPPIVVGNMMLNKPPIGAGSLLNKPPIVVGNMMLNKPPIAAGNIMNKPPIVGNMTVNKPPIVVGNTVLNKSPYGPGSLLNKPPIVVGKMMLGKPPIVVGMSMLNKPPTVAANVLKKPPIVVSNMMYKPPIAVGNLLKKPPIVVGNMMNKPPNVAGNLMNRPPLEAGNTMLHKPPFEAGNILCNQLPMKTVGGNAVLNMPPLRAGDYKPSDANVANNVKEATNNLLNKSFVMGSVATCGTKLRAEPQTKPRGSGQEMPSVIGHGGAPRQLSASERLAGAAIVAHDSSQRKQSSPATVTSSTLSGVLKVAKNNSTGRNGEAGQGSEIPEKITLTGNAPQNLKSNTDCHSKSSSDSHSKSNTDCQSKSNTDCHSKSNTDCHSKSNTDCHSKSNTDCHSKSNTDCHSKSNTDCHSKSNTDCHSKSSTDSYSKSAAEIPLKVRVEIPLKAIAESSFKVASESSLKTSLPVALNDSSPLESPLEMLANQCVNKIVSRSFDNYKHCADNKQSDCKEPSVDTDSVSGRESVGGSDHTVKASKRGKADGEITKTKCKILQNVYLKKAKLLGSDDGTVKVVNVVEKLNSDKSDLLTKKKSQKIEITSSIGENVKISKAKLNEMKLEKTNNLLTVTPTVASQNHFNVEDTKSNILQLQVTNSNTKSKWEDLESASKSERLRAEAALRDLNKRSQTRKTNSHQFWGNNYWGMRQYKTKKLNAVGRKKLLRNEAKKTTDKSTVETEERKTKFKTIWKRKRAANDTQAACDLVGDAKIDVYEFDDDVASQRSDTWFRSTTAATIPTETRTKPLTKKIGRPRKHTKPSDSPKTKNTPKETSTEGDNDSTDVQSKSHSSSVDVGEPRATGTETAKPGANATRVSDERGGETTSTKTRRGRNTVCYTEIFDDVFSDTEDFSYVDFDDQPVKRKATKRPAVKALPKAPPKGKKNNILSCVFGKARRNSNIAAGSDISDTDRESIAKAKSVDSHHHDDDETIS